MVVKEAKGGGGQRASERASDPARKEGRGGGGGKAKASSREDAGRQLAGRQAGPVGRGGRAARRQGGKAAGLRAASE